VGGVCWCASGCGVIFVLGGGGCWGRGFGGVFWGRGGLGGGWSDGVLGGFRWVVVCMAFGVGGLRGFCVVGGGVAENQSLLGAAASGTILNGSIAYLRDRGGKRPRLWADNQRKRTLLGGHSNGRIGNGRGSVNRRQGAFEEGVPRERREGALFGKLNFQILFREERKDSPH